MLRRPPEILITTPESLNILLTSEGGRSLLAGIRTVVLDEIHAVAGSKRGTHLITAVERLVLLSGEFQRIALSATVRPLERVAEFVGGYTRPGKGDSRYEPRPVSIIRADDARRYAVSVVVPDVDAQSREMESPGSCRGRNAKGLRGRCVIKRSLRLLPEGLH
jgi:ATP-dependent Lhr-like helicase